MALAPRVTAFKLKEKIWWIPAGTVFDYEGGWWHVQEPNDARMINETTLASAIEQIVGFSPEDEMDYDTIEVLKDFKPQPPKYIEDFEGNRYKLVTTAASSDPDTNTEAQENAKDTL